MHWTQRSARRADATLMSPARGAPRRPSPESPHVLVIGSGFGGLAAAVRLLVRGYRVTVLERLGQPGGRARVLSIDGHTFDAGPTLITAPFLFDELWELAGERREDHVELVPIDPFYRIRFDDGDVFEYTGDPHAMRSEVARFNPADVDGYEALLRKSERIYRVGFEELGHVPFSSVVDMARIAPAMVSLESWRTVHGLVRRHIRDPRLRIVFSFHPLLVGGNPFSTTSIYALIAYLERQWGVWYAMGGTGALVRGLAELIGRLGGAIRYGATVEEVTVETTAGRPRATGVRLVGGEHVPADLVVSNADAAWTYGRLLPESVRSRWTDDRLERARYSMSLFVWYFGTSRRYDDVAHHTILLGPRYRGLLRDVFDRHRLADDFSLYLHRPTATDRSMAPSGHDTFYVLSPVPHLDSGDPWDTAQTEGYRKAVEGRLEQTILPGLSDSLTASATLTPRGFLEDYLSVKGAAFSFEPTLLQSAYFRPHNASEDVAGLYLVGAGTHPGAGLPGVLSSARVLDTVVPPVEGTSEVAG
jgi:phytoene desaturase